MSDTTHQISKMSRPLVKICGLTDPANAASCANAGADIIGLVFYPKSPRHVTHDQAKAVVDALPVHVPAWGVFVNETADTICKTVNACGLAGVQLHGQESSELISALKACHLTVIKTVFAARPPGLDTVETRYPHADHILIECGMGKLPGGNAKTWDYGQAGEIAKKYSVIIAGGLRCDNIEDALTAALPKGVDVSSGVESAPGYKDIRKVSELIRRIKTKSPYR